MAILNFFFTILTGLLQLIGLILFKFYGWVVIVAILAYLIWQNRRREQWVSKTEHTLLMIEVPRENDKKELSAEQMFASLHGILRPKADLTKEGALQEHISFEIASIGNQIRFYVWMPKHLKDFVEGQIYAQYPDIHISEGVADYANTEIGDRSIYGTELVLNRDDVLPIKTFPSFEVDPLAGITAVMAKLEEPGEEMWIQVLSRPIEDSWQEKGQKFIEQLKAGKTPSFARSIVKELTSIPMFMLSNALGALGTPPEAAKKEEKKKGDDALSTGQKTMVKAIEEKITKLGYQVKIRIAYIGPNETLARMRLQAIVGGFKQFNTTNLNGFSVKSYSSSENLIDEYRARLFLDSGQTLNIEELASVYHLPHTSVVTPNISWTGAKTAEPPFNLPAEEKVPSHEVSLFGLTNFRGQRLKFGIKRADRGRHLYIIGQTGTGKSGLLQLLTLSDIYHNHGFAIIDPHGDYATDILKHIPEHRVKDVIYFNPADTENPMSFNPLEMIDVNSKNNVTSELVGVLKRMFESWGPRLEHILRFTILALLDTPNTTMLGITRMLTDRNYRKMVVGNIKDPVVRQFWVNEFASWNDKFANEAVAPVLNKVGAFIANPLIRNIVGQTVSTFNLRQVMDEGKILIVNLSRGMVGEDNAAILGALMVTKIQLAAMSRANVAMDQRRPFYLYVDEFQNFATDSFAVILSEARKYQLNLTVANQYITQMPDTVKEAVFGNVGSMVTFRVGAGDAAYLAKYYDPTFTPTDLVKLNNRHAFISMSIDGEKAAPFSATTLMMPEPSDDQTEQIIRLSRQSYASNRTEVEDKIEQWSSSQLDQSGEPTSSPDPSSSPVEQNPNSFLAALKNPSHSPDRPNPSQGRVGENRHHQAPEKRPNTHHQPHQTERHNSQASQPKQGQSEIEAGQTVRFR
jgi:hypothetical protein